MSTNPIVFRPAGAPALPTCPRCGPAADVEYAWQRCRNGSLHIRVTCGSCGAWIEFAAQVEPYLSLAGPPPEGPT
jgi:hypothetical protein